MKALRALCTFAVASVLAIGPSVSSAQDAKRLMITGDSSVPELAAKKQYAYVHNFRIGGKYDLDNRKSWEFGGVGGVTLESLGQGPMRIGYITEGTPERNAAGEIINAVVINTFYSGDSAAMHNFWMDGGKLNGFSKGAVVGKGKLIDTDKYFVVFLDALGLWGASKPSDGLGLKFPKYGYYDIVQANYRVLRDTLNIGKVKLVTGLSSGGTFTYVWGIMHSADGFVESMIPVAAVPVADSVFLYTFNLMQSALLSDPVWRATGGNYYHLPKDQHPNQGVMFAWSMLAHTGFDLHFQDKRPSNQVKVEVFSWHPKPGQGTALVQKAKDFDAVDLYYRNSDELAYYDAGKDLSRIKARCMDIHIESDQWVLIEHAREVASRAKCHLESFSSPIGHYAVFQAFNILKDKIEPFVNDKWVGSAVAAGVTPSATVAGKPVGLAK